ncbi:MAG: 2-aminoethylphosphonate--pyruvate transaminase [Gammaproteobacteria bacterium RIFCSPHIGHO2_12_FULL_45_9]|nr:MAG: 2-aminoethylphosphonate--pyruvate transaminase [Gammaproteobacteria bacterium RIFCSPHIGHO2_12_FULL_45_9]
MNQIDDKPPYLLLTPGPLSTSRTVRKAMWFDSCTWDNDYKKIVADIRSQLLSIANCDTRHYTTVLMQGSGSFGVEAVLGCTINRRKHQILILVNGVYGKRMVEMSRVLALPHVVYEVDDDKSFDANVLRHILQENPKITHLAVVHCETTTGMLNDIESIGKLAHEQQLYYIVDAMSSFGGMEFDISHLQIDFLISSSNKCLQGVPGFSFVICKKEPFVELCQNNAKSLCLDLYSQWLEMEKDSGKWRYTSPTHSVLAFEQALKELNDEGGIQARAARYHENQRLLAKGMTHAGFELYLPPALQSPIISTFIEPAYIPNSSKLFYFKVFYNYLKAHGFVIYPGKVAHKNSFRIGNIGHLFPADITRFLSHVQRFIEEANLPEEDIRQESLSLTVDDSPAMPG